MKKVLWSAVQSVVLGLFVLKVMISIYFPDPKGVAACIMVFAALVAGSVGVYSLNRYLDRIRS